jgi:hypothetical protein
MSLEMAPILSLLFPVIGSSWYRKLSSFFGTGLGFVSGLKYFIRSVYTRVARWYVFKQKISIWVNCGGPWNGKGWYILHMAISNIHITAIWNILRPFDIFHGHLVILWQLCKYIFLCSGIVCQ